MATFQPKIKNYHSSTIASSGINYSLRSTPLSQKSYKVIHNEKKKFETIAKTIMVDPFKHRRTNISLSQTQEPVKSGDEENSTFLKSSSKKDPKESQNR